jgi:hypothetical protein
MPGLVRPIDASRLGIDCRSESIADRLRLLHRVLADVQLGAYDRRIVEWMAKSTDTSTLLTILSLIERAKAAELAAERYGEHDRP